MGLYKRKGSKYWWYKIIWQGRIIRVSTKTPNKQLALQIEATRRLKLAAMAGGVRYIEKPPAFRPAMAEYLAWSEQQHADHPGTTERYRDSSVPLLKYFKNCALESITVEDVERYKSQRSREVSAATKRRVRPATVNRELACLRQLLNYYLRRDRLDFNPVSRVRSLPEDNQQMRVLSYAEERAYLACAGQPLRDVAVLMLETGMRPGEIRALRKRNVDLARRSVQVEKGKTRAARRQIHLSEAACGVLRARLASARGDYLFPLASDPQKPLLNVRGGHEGAVKRSGVSWFRVYDLRHTFATRAAQSGVDLVTLAALLGHSKLDLVMRYAHPTLQHQAEAIRKIQDARPGRDPEPPVTAQAGDEFPRFIEVNG